MSAGATIQELREWRRFAEPHTLVAMHPDDVRDTAIPHEVRRRGAAFQESLLVPRGKALVFDMDKLDSVFLRDPFTA